MSHDPPSSGGMPPPGRRPPTIDLMATEIESWPVTKEASQATDGAVEQESDMGQRPGRATAEAGQATGADPDQGTLPAMEASSLNQPVGPSASETAPEPAPEPAPEAATKAAQKAAPPRVSVGVLGLVGAGLLGGAVAAALALLLADRLPMRDNGARGLDVRLVRLEQLLRDIAARPLPADAKMLEEVVARLGKLEAVPVGGPAQPIADPALANRIARLEGDVKAMSETVGTLGHRGEETATTARTASQRADANATTLAELAPKVGRPAPGAVERSELEALAARVAELAKRPPDGSDRAGRLVLAATMLGAAVERGDAFAAELTAASSLAADPKLIAVLAPFAAAGVPTAPALARELAALAPSLHATAGSAPRDGGLLERLQANAEKIVRIRPLEGTAGDDAATVVAQIEVKAARNDVAGALAELAKLPAAARTPAEPWIKKAEMRTAAVEASRRLAADALAGLSK